MKYISGLSSPVFDQPGQRTLAILGSTGSIGTSALKVVAKNADALKIVALAGARNMPLLARQAAELRPEYLGVLNEEKEAELRTLLPAGYRPRILVGQDGYTASETPLEMGHPLAFAPHGGRPCDRAFPYFRLRFGDGGLSIAVGWPAQWSASFARVAHCMATRRSASPDAAKRSGCTRPCRSR